MRRRRLLIAGGGAVGLAAVGSVLPGCGPSTPQITHSNRLWLYARSFGTRNNLPGPTGRAVSFTDSIDAPYQSRWYKVEGVQPGDDLTVTLHMPPETDVDYTLLGYTDIRKSANRLLDQISSTGNVDADDMDSDDMDSDDMDSDDMDSDDMDSDDMDSDDMDSDDMDSDDMDSDDMDSDDMDSGDRDRFGDVYPRAQRHALRAASVTPGPADEQLHMIVRSADAGDYYFRVRGHLGASAAGKKFTIDVTLKPDHSCDGAPLQLSWSPPPPNLLGSKDTLILTNTSRTAEEPDVTKRTSLQINTEAERAQFLAKLDELARNVNGVRYDLYGNALLRKLFSAWQAQPHCVQLANTVVESIRMLIATIDPKRTLKYIVIAGADDVIPFARVVDRAEIAREWKWAGPYDPQQSLGAALTWGTYLSDDPYGRRGPLDLLGSSVRAPDVATGRLVETSKSITAYINWYLGGGFSGTKVKNALVAGYGFVSDLATDVATTFEAPPVVHADIDLNSDTNNLPNTYLWNVDDLKAKIRKPTSSQSQAGRYPYKGPYELIAVMGHYSAWHMRPPDLTSARLYPSDPEVSQNDLAGVLWMTIGCHSGQDVVDHETRAKLDPRAYVSWAEVLLSQGATVVAGTGYQYGESVLLENSEKLYSFLAQQIASTSGGAIGDALLAAKRRYLERRLQGRWMKGMDQKIVEVATLYGLPMWKIGTAATTPFKLPVPPAKAKAESPRSAGKDAIQQQISVEGLSATSAPQSVTFAPHIGSYFTTGEPPIVRPLRPVLPGVYRDVALAGGYPVGVLWTGGSFTDVAQFTPLISEPVTEEPLPFDRRPKYRNRAFLPARPFRVSRTGAQPGGARGYTLVFAPLQISAQDATATVRKWTDASFTLCYTSTVDKSALHDAPRILNYRVFVENGAIKVNLSVHHFASDAEEVQAYASYVDHGKLASVKLTGGASTQIAATVPTWKRDFTGVLNDPANPAPDTQTTGVFFQVMGGNGRVSSLTNGGQLFRPETAPRRRPTRLTLFVHPTATYRERITVTATLVYSDNGEKAPGDILFRLGAARIWKHADASGTASAVLTVATRPRDSQYLVVASHPADEGSGASSMSSALKVSKAKPTLPPSVKFPLPPLGGLRTLIGRLRLPTRDAWLGDRPIVIEAKGVDYISSTEQDGRFLLGAVDVALGTGVTETVTVNFEGDDRYEGASFPAFDISR